MQENAKELIKYMKNNKKGITLIALVVTIVVLIILATASINVTFNNNGIIKNVEESKLTIDYKGVKTSLEMYKLKKGIEAEAGKEIKDETLVGTIYKKVFVTETKRELGVIANFDDMGIQSTYGQGGKQLVKDDNNDMSTTKEIEKIYDLQNVYAIDLEDGNLYYINGNQIYGQETPIEISENGETVQKHKVETFNQEYVNRRKFITKWNVTLGEESGSETYSTVVLPINKTATYDATIYWGDGTSTLIQHGINGTTLTDAELTEKVTHQYELADNDDGVRTIEISGIYSDFRNESSTSTVTKLKLIEIQQWGDVGLTKIHFGGSNNLSGIVPGQNIKNCFEKCTDFGNLFYGCSITGISENFVIPEKITSMYQMFKSCKKLTNLPKNFTIPNSITSIQGTFEKCNSLESLPESFTIPDSVKTMNSTFKRMH